jgi:hypothetical protein
MTMSGTNEFDDDEFERGFDDQMAWLGAQPNPADAARLALSPREATAEPIAYNLGGAAACRSLLDLDSETPAIDVRIDMC